MRVEESRSKLWTCDGRNSFTVYCMYGVSGGTPGARRTTDHIVVATRVEMQHDIVGPKFLMGDINVVPQSILAIREMINEDQWTDVGSKAAKHIGGAESRTRTPSKTTANKGYKDRCYPGEPTSPHKRT